MNDLTDEERWALNQARIEMRKTAHMLVQFDPVMRMMIRYGTSCRWAERGWAASQPAIACYHERAASRQRAAALRLRRVDRLAGAQGR